MHVPYYMCMHVCPASKGDQLNSSLANMCKIEILPSSDFSEYTCTHPLCDHLLDHLIEYEPCKRRVIAQPFPGIGKGVGQWEELNDEQRQVCVSSVLPLECVNMVRALGVLLKYIDKRRLGVELEDQGIRVPILALRHFSLYVGMHVTCMYMYVMVMCM